MAEGLAVITDLAGVISLAMQVESVLQGSYTRFRGVETDVQQLYDAVSSLEAVLSSIQDFRQRRDRSFFISAAMVDALRQSSVLLTELLTKLRLLQTKRSQSVKSLMWPFQRDDIKKILLSLQDHRNKISSEADLGLIERDHFKKSNLAKDIEENRQSIVEWLSKSIPDPSQNHNSAREKCEDTTGTWILKVDELQRWLTTENSYIWLNGGAGSGKSILCSTVIDHVQKRLNDGSDSITVYWYFTFSDTEKQSVSNFVCHLVSQIFHRRQDIPDAVQQGYEHANKGQQRPSTPILMSMLREVMYGFDNVYLFVDALDECPMFDAEREMLLDVLREIHMWNMDCVHLFTTSRKEVDIKDSYESMSQGDNRFQKIVLEAYEPQVEYDIGIFLQSRLQQRRFQKWKPELKEEIEKKLSSQANGMFRWVALQLENLSRQVSPAGVREAMKTLPKTLDDVYDRILADIPEEYESYAQLAFQWLAYAARPLLLQELAEAVILRPLSSENLGLNDRFFHASDVFKFLPASLVTVITPTPKVHARSMESEETEETMSRESPLEGKLIRFAHFSVLEYLASSRIAHGSKYGIDPHTAHIAIAESCFAYLLHIGNKEPTVTLKLQDEFVLLRYAANCWPHHLLSLDGTGQSKHVFEFALNFLKSPSPAWTVWTSFGFNDEEYKFAGVALEKLPDRNPSKLPGPSLIQPIAWVSGLGLEHIVKSLLSNGLDLNDTARTKYFGSPLYAAAMAGHAKIVQYLLQAEAEIDREGGPLGTALQAALFSGHMNVVRLLLQEGADDSHLLDIADVNARGGCYETALQAASYRGHEEIVQLLINKKADVNAYGGAFGNALQAASYRGHLAITKLLLADGANVNALGGTFGSALQAAAYRGHVDVVRLLLQEGADVNARGGIYGTALRAAFPDDRKDVVAVLLRAGANETEDERWNTMNQTEKAMMIYEPEADRQRADRDEKDETRLDDRNAINEMLKNWLERQSPQETTLTSSTYIENMLIYPLLDDAALLLSFTAGVDGLPDHFERSLVRLLKRYAIDLKAEARGWLQINTVDMIRTRASTVAAAIVNVIKTSTNDYHYAVHEPKSPPVSDPPQEPEGNFVAELPLHILLPDLNPQDGSIAPGENHQDVPEPGDDHVAEVKSFLASSHALQNFRENLRILVFPHASQYIRTTLLAAGVENARVTKNVTCRARWEVLQYCQRELSGERELSPVLTVTGSPIAAMATTCEDYVFQTWGKNGITLLRAFVLGLESGSCDVKFSGDHESHINFIPASPEANIPESANISLSGSLEELEGVLSQLSWLAACFRIPSEGEFAMSHFNFQRSAKESSSDLEFEFEFELSILAPRPVLQASTAQVQTVGTFRSEQCWLPLFKEGILVCGFPIPERSQQAVGLQLDFPILALLSQVQGPIEYDGGIVLVGPSTLLFPTSETEDSIQWHLEEVDDAGVIVDILDKIDWKQEPDLQKLMSLKAYVGYCRYAQVLAGTEGLIQSNTVQQSQVKDSPSHLEIAPEGTFGLGISAKGFVNLSGGGKVVQGRGQRVAQDQKEGKFRDRVGPAVSQPVLVYDNETKRAWLVPELSIILHLAHAYLKLDWVQKLRSAETKQPYAEIRDNGGEAAFDAIFNPGDQDIGLDEKDETFKDLIDEYLKLFILIRKQIALAQASAGKRFFSPRLQGWDFVNLRDKSYLFYQRELSDEDRKYSWWKLSRTKGMLVIFGKNFGQLIQPDASKSKVCGFWNPVPEGAGLLTASMRCVMKIADECRENDANGVPCRWLVEGKTLEWFAPEGSKMYDYCHNASCNGSCMPIQILQPPSMLAVVPRKHSPPKLIEKNGAVIFGDPSEYRRVMQEKAKALARSMRPNQTLTLLALRNSIQEASANQPSEPQQLHNQQETTSSGIISWDEGQSPLQAATSVTQEQQQQLTGTVHPQA